MEPLRITPHGAGVAPDQGNSPHPPLHRVKFQLGPQPHGLQAHTAHASPQIPHHPAAGQVQLRQQQHPHFPLGHEAWMVLVLVPDAVVQTKPGQRRNTGLGAPQQHHQIEGVHVRGQCIGLHLPQALPRVPQTFRQPEVVTTGHPGGTEDGCHVRRPTPAWIRQHHQGPGVAP